MNDKKQTKNTDQTTHDKTTTPGLRVKTDLHAGLIAQDIADQLSSIVDDIRNAF